MPPRRRKPAIGPTLQEPSLQEQALQEQALPLDGASIGSVGAAPVGHPVHRQRLRSRFLTAGAAGFAHYELLRTGGNTTEQQSLLRNSSAALCLNKKNRQITKETNKEAQHK